MNKKLISIVTVLTVAVLGGATFALTNNNGVAPVKPVAVIQTAAKQGTPASDDQRAEIEAGSQAVDTQNTSDASIVQSAVATGVTASTPAVAAKADVAAPAVISPVAPIVAAPAVDQPVQPAAPVQEPETVDGITVAAGQYSDVYTVDAVDFNGNTVNAQWYKYSELSMIWSNASNKNLVLNVEILSATVGTSIDFRVGVTATTQPGNYEAIFILVNPANGNQLGFVRVPVTVTASANGTDEVAAPVVTIYK